MSTRSEDSSVPEIPAESAGSSVSTSLQKEYEDLLRYAVVTPKVIVPQMQKQTTKVPESITSTETSGESYEQDTRDMKQEVTGLPNTPIVPDTAQYRNRDIVYHEGKRREADQRSDGLLVYSFYRTSLVL